MNADSRERGATLIIVSLVLPVLILMTAFAVDLGRQRASRRTMQARADIVSLDLVRLADGRSEYDIINGAAADPIYVGTGGYSGYLAASAARNDVTVNKLAVVWGTWSDISDTFLSCGTPPSAPPAAASTTCIPNAVQVTASETSDYFFTPGSGNVVRTAVATQDGLAHLSLGSTLLQADLGNSALLNPVLTGLLCGAPMVPPPVNLCPRQANIGALGYQGLASQDLDLEDLRAAGGFGSVDELMQEDFTAEDFARLTAQAFRNNGDPTTAELYEDDSDPSSLASLTSSTATTFKMDDVMEVQSPANGAAAGVDVNPFNVFMAGLQVANGSNFVDLSNAVPPVTLPAGISNLAMTSRYQLIETPVEGIGRVGSAATQPPLLRTAQIRLVQSLTFNINVSVAGTGISGNVTLPIDVSGGGAEATLTAINCADPDANSTIDVTAAPRAITGAVGRPFTPASPLTIGNVNLTVAGLPVGSVGLSAYGAVDPGAQNTGAASLPGIAIDETRTGAGSGFSLGGAITNARLQTALGSVGALNVLIGATLNGLLTSLDTALAPALNLLGVSVSESAVRNIDVDCAALRLAD